MMKISIVTTVLNGAGTIQSCLSSIREQSVEADHIIVDGCSTDSTLSIINQYKTGTTRVISEKDKGIYDGMNKGLKMASGDIIGILNADDFYARNDILSKVRMVFENENVDSCYGDLVYVDHTNPDKIIRYWHSGAYKLSRFYWGWMPPHPTFFVRRDIYEKHGYFNLTFGSAADYELMLRFLVNYRITAAYIPETLVKMRVGGMSNATLRNRLKAHKNDRLAWKANSLKPYPWTLILKPLSKISQFIFK